MMSLSVVKAAAGGLTAGTGVVSAAATWAAAEATPVISENALVPIGLAAGLLVSAIVATVRVVRWVDRITADNKNLRFRIRVLERAQGIPSPPDEDEDS